MVKVMVMVMVMVMVWCDGMGWDAGECYGESDGDGMKWVVMVWCGMVNMIWKGYDGKETQEVALNHTQYDVLSGRSGSQGNNGCIRTACLEGWLSLTRHDTEAVSRKAAYPV